MPCLPYLCVHVKQSLILAHSRAQTCTNSKSIMVQLSRGRGVAGGGQAQLRIYASIPSNSGFAQKHLHPW